MNSIEAKINILKTEAESRRGSAAKLGFHWPQSFREDCLLLVQSGANIKDLAKEIGIPWKTLERWKLKHLAKTNPSGESSFREVKITAEKSSSSLFIRSSKGYEIYGLSLADIKKLIEAKLL